MLGNPHRRAKVIRNNARLYLVNGSEIDMLARRKAAIRAATELKRRYAMPVNTGDTFSAGPTVLKNEEDARIVATRKLIYDEPTFG